ncbi:hypothetical protein [Sporomusa sphaeroides]|uniref:hypothetical protein n=1 Tax=Sporomusa sphaeroides TaxID=47679 RepID=UPI002C09A4E1|nr:hypothetical protein [Sporomusa sphaeroides]HML35223.1 hypothetical protein [Sporomusa sphaeroides]
MEILCSRCGIAEIQRDGKRWCLKYQLDVSDGAKEAKADCYYFIEPQFEDGEPMTVRENLMFKECELASRKMRGPV